MNEFQLLFEGLCKLIFNPHESVFFCSKKTVRINNKNYFQNIVTSVLSNNI